MSTDTVPKGNKPIPSTATPPAGGIPIQPPPQRAQQSKVRATQVGYLYEQRRRVGDVFVLLDEKHFSAKWMERVDPNTPEKVTTGQQVISKTHDEIQAGRLGLQLPDAPTGELNPLGE